MILLSLSSFSWAAILAILLSFLLTIGVFRRVPRDKAPGCSTYGCTGLVISAAMIFVLACTVTISRSVDDYFTKPKYRATIVSFNGRWEEKEKSGNSRVRTGYRRMHTPVVQFISKEGRTIIIRTDVSRGAVPVIGDHLLVAYAPGDRVAQEISVASVGLLSGAALIMFIIALALFAVFRYALGADTKGIKSFSMGFLLRFLMPLGMLFFLAGMSYALWQYFAGKQDMPLWAVFVCGFFCLLLLIVIPVFLKLAFGKDRHTVFNN
jgi:hypothetical protein